MVVRVDRHADPAAFWQESQAFLERDEAGNTQVLAIAARHAAEPGNDPPSGLTVSSRGELIAAAIMTAKGTLFLTPAGVEPLQALRQSIVAAGQVVIDIVGEKTTAEAYGQLAGTPFRTHVGLRLYRLETVNAIRPASGSMRQAILADSTLLCAWQRAFLIDANVRGESVDEIPQQVERRLLAGGTWLWEVDGGPVAYVGYRPTPIRSVRIAPVYTPPEHRGHGYATALVAALCRHLIEDGRLPLYLFADTNNPTANGVYRRVGFHPAGEHVHLTRADGG